MTAHELMIKTNHYLIKGGSFTPEQKRNIVGRLMDAQSTEDEKSRFYIGVKFPDNRADERRMYPDYFIPPYNNGRKLRTVFGQLPKTHILSANMYELEIIRLLYIFMPDDPTIKGMVEHTLSRLKTTCFANYCGHGECYDTSLVVLRFLAATAPNQVWWQKQLIDLYHKHYAEKHRVWQIPWYFNLCLSELPFEISQPELMPQKDEIVDRLTNKSCVMNSEQDKTIHPVIICMLRNLLSRLPEYEYIKDRQPYVDEKDGRLHFDMTPTV